MNPGESIAELFGSINIFVACLWVTGFILFSVEFFQPMHDVAYTAGITMLGTAFVTSMINGSPGEAFMFVLFTAVALFVVHVVSLRQRRDWLRVARIEKAGERRRKYNSLIDSIGVANTPIDFTGNVTINNVNLVVYSETPIPSGEKVRIVGITQDKILVERADAKSEQASGDADK